MRIPITTGDPEDLWRRETGSSLHASPRVSHPFGYHRGGTGRTVPGSTMPDRTNLAVQNAPDSWEDEDAARAGERAVQEEEERIPARNQDTTRTEEAGEDWKGRYIRLRADFDNYKRQ